MPRQKKGENRQLQDAGEFKGPDTEKEALEKIETARLAAEKEREQDGGAGTNGGPEPTLRDEAAWKRATLELTAETIELEDLAERQAEVRGRISSVKKVAEKCGVDWDVIKLKVKLDRRVAKGEMGAIVTEQRRLGSLMRLMESPLHTQFGLFPEEPKSEDEANGAAHIAEPELAGQHAYSNGEKMENNPHQPGTLAHQEWSIGWSNAEAANARSMGPAPTETETTH